MSSKEAHRNFGEDLFFLGDHLILTEKTYRNSLKTFFFGDHIIIWTKLQFTKPEIRHTVFQLAPGLRSALGAPAAPWPPRLGATARASANSKLKHKLISYSLKFR